MKIEAGKYYKTRDGRKVGPMASRTSPHGWIWEDDEGFSYDCRGRFTEDKRPYRRDLIAEWTDEPRPWGDWESAKGWEKDDDWLERIEPGHLQILMPDGEQRTIHKYTDLPKGGFAAFRIKPEPVVKAVMLHGARGVSFTEGGETHFDTHRITFTTTDGEPATGTFTNENGDVMTMERIDAG